MLHLATIQRGLHEYIVMLCTKGEHWGKTYIEEVVLTSVDFSKDVYANLKFISDDTLAEDLAAFAREKGVLDQKRLAEILIDTGRFERWMMNPDSMN